MSKLVAPACSPLQKKTALAGSYPPVPKNCVVTGGTGFVGLRLVEMLLERGAEKVVAFDVVGVDELPAEVRSRVWKHPKIEYVKGDITNLDDLIKAFKGADCVWHIAAAVGPFHPQKLYEKVNYEGTINVVEACKVNKVKKIVMSSSPSTRMDGSDIDGLSEDELPKFEEMEKGSKWLQAYAESKFRGENFLTKSCSDELMTVAVAPHQVYGPRDNLFLPNIMEAAGIGKLRVFSKAATGYGKSKVCFTYVDNYCHGLILAERALYQKSPALGKFYIVTDAQTHPFPEGYLYLWDELDSMAKKMGFSSIKAKTYLPYWLLMPVAYISVFIGYLMGAKLRLSPFTVTMLTMHRWFAFKNSQRDLKYEPIVAFKDGWEDTAEWFRENWLPGFLESSKAGKIAFSNLAVNTQNKIDIQKESSKKIEVNKKKD